jgi:murein DD-endopeptidase MepM/ murein hydrolase activator NlpD
MGVASLGGNVVDVVGPGFWRHYYAHLDGFGNVHPGDVIEKGRILGYVGDTGNAKGTPCHLHYGISMPVRGWIDPRPLLRDEPARALASEDGAPESSDLMRSARVDGQPLGAP